MKEQKQFGYPGTLCTEQMVGVNERVSIRLVRFVPPVNTGRLPLVLVVGLSTIMESFRNILYELTRDFPVYYIETREKSSSSVTGKVAYGMEALGEDVCAVVRHLQLKEDGYALLGYSLGATAILDCYPLLPARPAALLLMEPTPVFHYPRWALWLIRWMAEPAYPLLKPFAKWYLRTFTINTKEDQELALISSRALDHADPYKLKTCILSIAAYTVWHRLEGVDCPSLIIATSKDRFHVHEEISRMARTIRNCGYIDLEDNKRTHSEEMGRVVRRYILLVEELVPGPGLPSKHYQFTTSGYEEAIQF